MNNSRGRRAAGRMPGLSLTLIFIMLFTLLASAAAESAEAAKSNRLAVITEVGGTVTVQSAGGSKAYEAYVNMGLNQGDYLRTEADSYAVLKIKDTEDEFTIGADSEIYISELAPKGSGKTSKIKMWAGSIWSSVKKLVSDEDELEVETPTAAMAVRGTHFLTIINKQTGETSMVVASGVVRASTLMPTGQEETGKSLQESQYVNVYPAQQIVLDNRTEISDLRAKVEFMNIHEIIQNAPPQVLERIIENKREIDEDNEAFLNKTMQELQQNGLIKPQDSALLISNESDLDKVKNNLDSIIGNIAKQAIDEKKIDNKIIEQANKKIGDPAKKLDLDHIAPLDPTAGIDPEQEKIRQAEAKRLDEEAARKLQELERLLLENQKRLAALLQKIEGDKAKQDQANRQAALEETRKAEQELLSKLTKAQQEAFMANKTANQAGSRTGTQTGSKGGTDGDTGSGTGTVNEPSVIAWITPGTAVKGHSITLEVHATDTAGVKSVEFYVQDGANRTNIGSGTKSGDYYRTDWTPPEAGAYTLVAKVTDKESDVLEKSILLNVNEPEAVPPSVTLDLPAEDMLEVQEGTIVRLQASAQDADGIKSLVFRLNGITDLTPESNSTGTYSLEWKPAAGTYAIKAVATDNTNAAGESARTVTVKVIPDIQLLYSTASPSSQTGELIVNLQNFNAKAVQLHFTTTDGRYIKKAGEPTSKVFDNSGKRTYKSSLNTYTDQGERPNYEYVFAALSADGVITTREPEVFRIPVYKPKEDTNVKLAYIKLVLADGSAIEITPAANNEVVLTPMGPS